ncbi:IclR family transcriptional regulator [Allopusillimonas ginsengisoli]|uniref:IclR family transcriptional regulator n=1 Tax=Allopusillimonas ginsengisoli TaxID=453575 RepID=UPI00101F5C33|nr:helix-turn-helix domain-containing protein [Allopusillimonas ginsengisoli]TEA78864.1 winged helix-turn-helix transcriptional regulator [Allopusillimonas ginsengisoli]
MARKEELQRLALPAQNRSLERGIEILRAFRPGAGLLGNSELADRTHLSPATVSRLTQTLVRAGMLDYDHRERAYRLAAPLLSLGQAMRAGSPLLQTAAPLMRATAETLKINVGLATRDRDEMVYLESVRYNRKVSLRNVVAGLRVPIELTSLGRAYLAVVSEAERHAIMAHLRARRSSGWDVLEVDIETAVKSVAIHGYCIASWQPEVVALATPLVFANHPIHVLNVSVAGGGSQAKVEQRLYRPLLKLAELIMSNVV